MEQMEIWLVEIYELHPTDEEMEAFVSYLNTNNLTYGIVAGSEREYYGDQRPRIHNTYGQKWGGRAHIDMGFNGKHGGSVHLMLGRHDAPFFINFIKEMRKEKSGNV